MFLSFSSFEIILFVWISSTLTDILKGVPSYALYKHLAASLYQTISSGAFVRASDKISFMHQEESLKLKEDEWTKLTLERGMELLNV